MKKFTQLFHGKYLKEKRKWLTVRLAADEFPIKAISVTSRNIQEEWLVNNVLDFWRYIIRCFVHKVVLFDPE